jgi:mannose-1-phosphate guanylyltransferase
MVPIAGVPLLGIWLDLCARAGVTHVLVNVSRHADHVERFLAASARPVAIRLVREAAPVGNAGTVRANRAFVAGEESFYIFYADTLTDVSLDALAAAHAAHDAPLTMGLFHAPDPRAAGIVEVRDDGLVTSFEEKPAHPAGSLANAGVYVGRQGLFDAIPARDAVVDFGHDVLPRLTGRMYGRLLDGYLRDIGTPEALARALQEWTAGASRGGRP